MHRHALLPVRPGIRDGHVLAGKRVAVAVLHREAHPDRGLAIGHRIVIGDHRRPAELCRGPVRHKRHRRILSLPVDAGCHRDAPGPGAADLRLGNTVCIRLHRHGLLPVRPGIRDGHVLAGKRVAVAVLHREAHPDRSLAVGHRIVIGDHRRPAELCRGPVRHKRHRRILSLPVDAGCHRDAPGPGAADL
ncbi:hypothetical protein ABQ433_25300, partial [Citrobacter freundii]